MSERMSERDSQLWEALRNELSDSCGILLVTPRASDIIDELEMRSSERAEKRQRSAQKYAAKHPGKRARW